MTYQRLHLPFKTRPLLAFGGEVKNTFCLAFDHDAVMSPPIGDMQNVETLTAFEAEKQRMETIFGVTPEIIACDLHPGYRSSQWAAAYAEARSLPLVKVQHHHAHIAALMTEQAFAVGESVIGMALDGTGYGTDGCIWGGEVLIADYCSFTRAAHLRYVPLPGGDSAIRKPYRMALAYLWSAGIPGDGDLPPVQACSEMERRILRRQFERRINTVPTSSIGRLFDAVASMLGLRQIVSFEGEAAIELEACAAHLDTTPYSFRVDEGDWPLQLDPAPMLRALVEDWRAGIAPELLAAWFHVALANALVLIAQRVRERTHINTVALSGGVFQNHLLLHVVQQGLLAQGFTVLTHQQVPTHDGGLALGQAAIASLAGAYLHGDKLAFAEFQHEIKAQNPEQEPAAPGG